MSEKTLAQNDDQLLHGRPRRPLIYFYIYVTPAHSIIYELWSATTFVPTLIVVLEKTPPKFVDSA